MNRHNRVSGVVLSAQHLLGFRGVYLFVERVKGLGEVGSNVFTALRPLEQHADVVDFLGEAVA
jgi:hypothetical protein